MRKKFLHELFNPQPAYNWESKINKQKGEELLKESERLKIFKEVPPYSFDVSKKFEISSQEEDDWLDDDSEF